MQNFADQLSSNPQAKQLLENQKAIRQMLAKIGIGSLEDLYAGLPEEVKFKGEYDMPEAMSEQEVRDVLGKAQWLPRVVELDRAQPEFTRTPWAYLDSAVSPQRIAQGQAQLAAHGTALQAAAAQLSSDLGWGVTPQD